MGRRRLLTGLAVVVVALLVVGLDGLIVHHFGRNAATKNYPDNYLSAVACPSSARCWAVGQTAFAPGGNTLSEVRRPLLTGEQAGHWRPVTAAAGASGALTSIACPGAADCWAVGGDAARGHAVIEHWTGGAWQLVAAPALPGGQLNSISCASAAACWALGGTQVRSGAAAAVLEQWNGARWSTTPALAGALQPQQLSCPVTGFCLALGTRNGQPGAARYAAGRWTAVPAPPAPPGSTGSAAVPSLFGCTGQDHCLAAFPGSRLTTDVWNGRAWTPVTSAKLTYPVSMACSQPGCWLLGMTRKSRPLALRWQGGTWAPVTVPAARRQGYLTGLACGSQCWAVGGKGGTRRNGVPYTSPLIAPLA